MRIYTHICMDMSVSKKPNQTKQRNMKNYKKSWIWVHNCISSLGGQNMVHKSEASLSYIVNPCLINTKGKKKKKKKNQNPSICPACSRVNKQEPLAYKNWYPKGANKIVNTQANPPVQWSASAAENNGREKGAESLPRLEMGLSWQSPCLACLKLWG